MVGEEQVVSASQTDRRDSARLPQPEFGALWRKGPRGREALGRPEPKSKHLPAYCKGLLGKCSISTFDYAMAV